MASLDVSLEHREFLILKQGIHIQTLRHIINTDKATFKEKLILCMHKLLSKR